MHCSRTAPGHLAMVLSSDLPALGNDLCDALRWVLVHVTDEEAESVMHRHMDRPMGGSFGCPLRCRLTRLSTCRPLADRAHAVLVFTEALGPLYCYGLPTTGTLMHRGFALAFCST
jgi:hypothetical protein